MTELVLHCLWPYCTKPGYPWCSGHDFGPFRRKAIDRFGWSLRKEDYGTESKVPHA